MILGIPFKDLASWVLAVFFMVGAIGNGQASHRVKADYRRWGYPRGFHRITGALEVVVALLLAFPITRLGGVALGAGVMLAALATLLHHREYRHAVLPGTVLVALATLAVWSV